jgi:Ser/Thr protein kinase RdoA (MazF antagonist)
MGTVPSEPEAGLASALAAYGVAPDAPVTRVAGGLINRTYMVDAVQEKRVLQRLHAIFTAPVHDDIEVITAHLQRRGMPSPRLLRTRVGELCYSAPDGTLWRMMTFLPGRVVHTVTSPALGYAAGQLVARFHRAVSDLQHRFHFSRPGAHDTPAHMERLRRALGEHTEHANYAEVAPVGERILATWAKMERLPALPVRIIHGDLKVSNLLFNEQLTEGVALLDLDTMAHLTLPVELGDAFRSWCNPAGEDEQNASLDRGIMGAAVRGYAEQARGLLVRDEVDALVLGVQTIALELSARFCADALHEAYFGWNPVSFPSRSEHNRVRAKSQLAVALSVERQRGMLEGDVRRAFGL